MARTVQFSELREKVRVRYDLPAFSTTTWATTAIVNSLINESLQGLYALLIDMPGENYFAASSTLTTVASTATTSLPTRAIKLTALWWVRGTDDVYQIERGSVDDLKLASYSAKSWTDYCPKYRLQGTSTILWLPTPNDVYSVRCDYVALPADLSADGDTFDAGSGWEDWVISDVCRKLALREEKDPSAHLVDRDVAEARIRRQAPERTESEPLRIRDNWSFGGGMSAYELRNRITQGDF